MKKVPTILLLVLAMLLTGCKSGGHAKKEGSAKAASKAAKTGNFWAQDFKPVITLTPKSQADAQPGPQVTQEQPAMTEPAPQKTEPVVGWTTTSVKAAPAAEATPPGTDKKPARQPDVVTASVEEFQPVATGVATPANSYERPVGLASGLVAMDETGGHAFSMTYPRPDYGIIQVDKTMPEEVRLNQPFAYIIKVTNLTEMAITDITLTETLSKEFTFKGAEPTTSSADGNKLVWSIDSLGPKASKSIKVSGIATNAKQLEHCTTITHAVRGDCATVPVVEPTLELAVDVQPENLLCEAIPIDFVVRNTGTGAAQNVQITDVLPVGLQTADGKDRVSLDVGTLAAGESRRFSVKLRATKTGAYASKATAVSVAGLKAESQTTLINVRQPILTIKKSGPQRQYLGRSVAYEITVLNKGDGSARDTMVEDIIPPGVTSIEATSGAQFSASKLMWELGTLEPNASKKVRVSYVPTREGDVMATATASAYCADAVTDSTRTTVTGIAASRLDLVDLEDPVEVGMTTTYVITVTNEGSAPDRNIRIACILDDKLQYVSSAGATAGAIVGRTVTFGSLSTLEPKAKATWRVVVKGARAGDALFKTTMYTGELTLPVEATEATHLYQQFGDTR